MEVYMPYLTYILTAIIFILVLKFIFKVGIRTIIKIIINIVAGGIVLCLVNFIPGLNLPITALNSFIVGIFGFPGVIFVIIYHLLGR